MYTLVTDGAYSSTLDQGGVGIVFLRNGEKIAEYSRKYKSVTNNIMELGAVIIGLRLIKNPIDSLTILTDSEYVIGCATKGWKRNKNIKLWEEFDKQYERVKSICPEIIFKHVKGHYPDGSTEAKWNNYVDNLAYNSSRQI